MKAEPWTAEQIKYLSDNYHLCDIKDLAAKLGRTVYACKNRIAQIAHTPKRKIYSERKCKRKSPTYKKALPQDRWQDAEDFINMMAKLKRKLTKINAPVGDSLFNGLPRAFGQYQCEIGR